MQLYKKMLLLSLLSVAPYQASSAFSVPGVSGFNALPKHYKLLIITALVGSGAFGGAELYNKDKKPEDKISAPKIAAEATGATFVSSALWLYRHSIMSFFSGFSAGGSNDEEIIDNIN